MGSGLLWRQTVDCFAVAGLVEAPGFFTFLYELEKVTFRRKKLYFSQFQPTICLGFSDGILYHYKIPSKKPSDSTLKILAEAPDCLGFLLKIL